MEPQTDGHGDGDETTGADEEDGDADADEEDGNADAADEEDPNAYGPAARLLESRGVYAVPGVPREPADQYDNGLSAFSTPVFEMSVAVVKRFIDYYKYHREAAIDITNDQRFHLTAVI
ncbi:hypothetical protein MBANPS3_012147 [Mucor bainieri]